MIQQEYRESNDINVGELLEALLQKWWLIAICSIGVAAACFVLSAFVIPPKYESTTSIYILNRENSAAITYSDTQLSTQLTKDYEALITSRYVLEQVMSDFGLDCSYEDFEKKISAQNAVDTRIIYITVKDTNPDNAKQLADAIRDRAAEHITSVMSIEAVNLVDEANTPDTPTEPSVIKWTFFGFMAGILISIIYLVLKFINDDTIRNAEDIENYLGLSVLAMIPDKNHKSGKEAKE